MKVSQRQINDLHEVISIEVENVDYQEKVESKLRDYRKKANIPGFRPGKVPMGIIRKQFEKSIMFDEINHLLSHKVNDHIAENKIRIIGQPLPVPNESIDWNTGGPFTFEFEIGLEPKVSIDLSKLKGITKPEITLEAKQLEEEIMNFRRRYGKMVDQETAEAESFLLGKFEACDAKGKVIENGLSKEGSLPLRALEAKVQKKWTGKKAGDSDVLNLDKDIQKGFNEASITGFEAEDLTDNRHFLFTINKVSELQPAEMNQELFDKIFGEGNVTSEEDFRKEVEKRTKESFQHEASQYFFNQVYHTLMKTDMNLPETFLKKWVRQSSEEPMSEEEVNEQYPQMLPSIKWQFIRDHILQTNEVQIDEASMKEAARQRVMRQFQLPGANEEMLDSIANILLEREEEREKIVDDLLIGHLMRIFDEQVSAKVKKMSWDDFVKEAEKDAQH